MMFVSTTGFTRGEVDAALWDRVDVDFYRSASKYIENWLPDLTGAISRRPRLAVGHVAAPHQGDPRYNLLRSDGAHETSEWDFALHTVVLRSRELVLLLARHRRAGDGEHVRRVLLSVFAVDEYAPGWSLTEVTAPQTILATVNDPQVRAGTLSDQISFAQAGPSVFIASSMFSPRRVYETPQGEVAVEQVAWREEIMGTVEVEHGSHTWTGTDTLFKEQLPPGVGGFEFQGKTYTIAERISNTEMTTVEEYTGPSISGGRITKIGEGVFGSSGQYPSLVAFHRSRLFLFSTPERPLAMWASSTTNPFVIVPGSVYDDAPINADLLAEGAGAFQWVSTGEHIYLGTENGEFVIATPYDRSLTPTTISFSRISAIGGAGVTPALSEASTLFVPRSRAQVLASQFDDASQGYRSTDISLLASHLLESGVAQMALRPAARSDRVPRLFVLTGDRKIRACALQEQENVAAWSRIELPAGDVPRAVAASAAHAYFLVQRPATASDGTPTVLLARLAAPGADHDLATLDYATLYAPETITEWPVAEPLQGHVAAVVSSVRGVVGYTPPLGATIDFSDYGWQPGRDETMTLGVPFRSRLELLPAAGEDGQGAWLSRRRRMVRARISVRDTHHLTANGQPLLGAVGTEAGNALRAVTGVLEYRQLGWGTGEELDLETSYIYPAQVLSVVREVKT